jgi:hypothetical protein
MRGNGLVTLLIIVGIICIALGIYYIIPGVYHPLTFSGTPSGSHVTHFIVFIALGAVSLIASRFFRQSVN